MRVVNVSKKHMSFMYGISLNRLIKYPMLSKTKIYRLTITDLLTIIL